MLHNDIPTKSQIERLASAEGGWRVSIYVESGVLAQQGELARIALKDATRAAVEQMETRGASAREIAPIREHLEDIEADALFWTVQSRSLAVFADAEQALTFRLPNKLAASMHVGSRFHIKPLLRTTSFAQACFVLALSANDVRLIALTPDEEPRRIESDEIPKDFEQAVHRHFGSLQTAVKRTQGDDGEKTRLRQFARVVDRGVRHAIGSSHLPVFLAATEPLDGIFRGTSSLPHLAEEHLGGNAELLSDQQLADLARTALDGVYAAELREFANLLSQRENSGRGVTDLSDIARAAAFGAIHTLVFDMDAIMYGSVDSATGEVAFAPEGATEPLGVLEDIVRLALASDSRIIAVRANEVPGGGSAAAVLRYAV